MVYLRTGMDLLLVFNAVVDVVAADGEMSPGGGIGKVTMQVVCSV